jgi:dipeptidyl aminopeptidase/acylaminoacyl peptidase
MLTDGTISATTRGLRAVFANEDGSHPRSYHSVLFAPGGIVIREGSVTPPRFAPGADPWSTRIVGWQIGDEATLGAQHLIPGPPHTSPPTVIVPYGGYRNAALSTTYFLDVLLRELLNGGWQVIRPNTSAANVLAQRSGYGAVQLSDIRDLVDSLAARSVLDPRRVAVIGHSHGASLAYYFATHSTVFCAIVAVNGRTDWVMQARYQYDGLLPGPLGASPDKDPALYAAASPLPNARAVTAPILLVAGANDGQILPVNATAMADSLREYSRAFDLLFFEDEGHMIEADANRDEFIRRAKATLEACR